jgi:RND family efflux transporter MFP subunit
VRCFWDSSLSIVSPVTCRIGPSRTAPQKVSWILLLGHLAHRYLLFTSASVTLIGSYISLHSRHKSDTWLGKSGAVKRLLLLCSAIAILALGGVVLAHVFAKQSGNGPQNEDFVRVARRDVGSVVKATGIVKPMVGAEVRVGSSASGVVSRLYVRIGDRVKKGDLLAELDSRELSARRDAAEAAVRLASANLTYTRTDLQRKRDLSEAAVVARSELDLAQQAYGVAEQQYEQAQANLGDAITQLGYTRIVAPITGTVESVSTQEGETVAASLAAPTFVTLLDLSRLEVWAYVDETDIGRIQVGQKASFTVDTYGDYEFQGRVTAIYPQAQIRDNVVDYVTVIRFQPPPDRVLRPEMTTTVTIALEQHKNVLALPNRAVHGEGGSPFVMVRHGNTTEQQWIAAGLRDDSYCEILNGLREGDEVLVNQSNKL